MLGKIKQKFKDPLTDYMYKFLMREAQYHWGRKPFGPEELQLVTEALVTQNLFGIDGKMVNAFEKEFAQLYNVPYAVASTSGTAAIHTALGVLDLNPGDEVITAPITDLGTVIPILSVNAIPVFADVDQTYNMNPADVESKITPRTRAILAVHLFGNPCNLDALAAIARKHKIPLIEDCAQAHLTEYKGKYVGTIGDIGCYSFQQSKHMTTGDGGMCVTSNKALYERMKLYVDKGFARKGWGARAYAFHAPNYRMNELTAAVGRAQLKKLKGVVQKRQAMGKLMSELLTDVPGIVKAPVTDGASHSFWLYPIFLQRGDLETFAKTMTSADIWCGAGYTGKPIYLCAESLSAKKTYGTSQFPFNSAFASRPYEYVEGLCPVAEETLKHLVTMPWDESWSEEKVRKAAAMLKETAGKISGDQASAQAPKPASKTPEPIAVTTSAKKMRVAIIGCGQMGEWHWNAYRKNSNAECVAFVDTDRTRAERFIAKTPAPVYTDYREMIKNEKLDGASLCTIPSTHHPIIMDLLDAGINVLCEKPLAVSLTQAQAMTQKANDKKLKLLTAFKFRFYDEVLEAKELLDKGSFGKILNFRVMFGAQMDMAGSWYSKKELSGGGVVMDNAPHAFDLIRYLMGDIARVRADVNHIQNLSVEDTAHLTCLLKSGGCGTIDISWSLPTPSKHYCEIYAEEGALLLDFEGLTHKFKTWDDWKRTPNKTPGKEAFNRQIDHFVQAIGGTPVSVTTNEDGLKTQKLIEEVYASLKP